MSDLNRIVVAGASLAGLRAAETLRSEGFDGEITIIGDESHRPYDRPPLSKQFLAGEWDAERIALPAGVGNELDVDWILGAAATSLDLETKQVGLADGRSVAFDGLIIATGARAKLIPGTEGLEQVVPLRTLDDAARINSHIESGAKSVLVIGAGFIGAEAAATCKERGLEVTMIEPLSQPLVRVLGEQMGSVIADMHRSHGIDLRLGIGMNSISASTSDMETATSRAPLVVELSDGSTIHPDLAIIGAGVTPNTEWLDGSGLRIDDGVCCDETLLAAPNVVACGDVARWPNPLYGEEMRVEHWEHALAMGSHAARRLLSDDSEPFAPVPWFWSDQYDRKLQMAGRGRPDDQIQVIAGSTEELKFCALYGRNSQVTGVLAMNMAGRVVKYRRLLAEGLSWDDALAGEGITT